MILLSSSQILLTFAWFDQHTHTIFGTRSPHWWHLGWSTCQRWLCGKLLQRRRGCPPEDPTQPLKYILFQLISWMCSELIRLLMWYSPWSSPWILALAASCLNVKVLMFINEYLKIIVREVIDWNQPQKRGCCRHLWWLSKSRAFSIPWSARKQSSSSSWWQRSSIWQQATLRTKIFVFLWNKWFFASSFASYLLSANGPMQNACTLVSKFCFRLNKLGPIIKYQI